jgi:hypothetical protein
MRGVPSEILEKMYGMNFNWLEYWSGGADWHFPAQTRFNDLDTTTFHPITSPFYYDTAAVSKPTFGSYYELLREAAYGNDIRIYMPGTSGITNEYNYKWIHRKRC